MAATPSARPRRWRLYAPFVLLAILAAAWAVGWMFAQRRVLAETAAFRQREAAAGRVWTCPDETVAGFPFRIELTCRQPVLTWGPEGARLSASLEGLLVVAQVYQPNRVILDAAGPFTLALPDGRRVEGSWQALRASLSGRPDRLERLSVVSREPAWRVAFPDGTQEALAARRIEIQGRPHPERFAAEQAVDVSLKLEGASLPAIDALAGNAEPADLDVVATLTQAGAALARDPVTAAEDWRSRGGTIAFAPFGIAKGRQKLEARGVLAIDDTRRPFGRLDLAARGLDDLVGRLTGGNQRMTALVMGGLAALGRQQQPNGQDQARAGDLGPLPPLRFQNGRVSIGPLPVADLPPLY